MNTEAIFKQARLSNGLTVIAEIQPEAMSVACGFFVRTGSRDETRDIFGVSHFLEHMMFKGTENRTSLEITYGMGAIGAQSNAYTSNEVTVFYAAVLPEYFEQMLEILSDMMRPALVQEEFDTEKGVILEEIALYQDRPAHVLFDSALQLYFAKHSAGNSVLGTTQSVSDLSRQAMLDYFNSRYVPGNIVLAATGKLDWENYLEMAERFCGHWQAGSCERLLAECEPDFSDVIIKRPNLNKGYACLIAPGPSVKDPFLPSARVLSCILGDSSGSKVYWSLIHSGLADSASVDMEDMDDVGIFTGFLSSDSVRTAEVLTRFKELLSSPLDFTTEDLHRAKTKLRTRLVLQRESSFRRMNSLGHDWLAYGENRTLQDKLAEIDSVSRDSIAGFVNKYPLTRMKQILLLPE